MGDINLETAAEAWRRASNADLAAVLSAPDELEPDVLPLVQREAERRGLDLAAAGSAAPRVRRTPRPIVIGAGVLKANLGYLSEHRYLTSGLAAALVAVAGSILSPVVCAWLGRVWPVWSVFLVLLYVTVMALCVRPLRSYRAVLLVSLSGSACFVTVMQLTFLLRYGLPPQGWLAPLAIGGLVNFTVFWALPSLLLCGAVAYGRRRWPEYGAGKCKTCGYDLRGLSEPRCPECGSAFDVEQCAQLIEQDP